VPVRGKQSQNSGGWERCKKHKQRGGKGRERSKNERASNGLNPTANKINQYVNILIRMFHDEQASITERTHNWLLMNPMTPSQTATMLYMSNHPPCTLEHDRTKLFP
jgi:hypothetical protein